MSSILLVPIHLDALCLDSQDTTTNTHHKSLADYRRLPFIYQNDAGEYETNRDGTANLSEEILTSLFGAGLRSLKAGIHLHWSLPDGLTRGQHSATGTKFPVVPNRWLIWRQGGDKGNKQWVLESDYLYPEDQDPEDTETTVNILVERPGPETRYYKRYRYMGRNQELSVWQEEQSNNSEHEYTTTLTAIGPKAEIPLFDSVKATFAAFYPNCQSVFGFYDSDYPTTNPPSGLQYDVIGWYSNQEQDCLKILWENNQDKTSEELLEILNKELRWTFNLDAEFPQQTLYHSRVTFTTTDQTLAASDRIDSLSVPTIAVGNSAPEALSAYLAHLYNSDETGQEIRQIVEEQLDALQLSERLESRKLDLDAKLKEARHEWGFGTRRAGVLWSISPKGSNTSTTTQSKQSPASLNVELAHQLNQVNLLQEEYNQALVNIESQRQELYAHWYEYMKENYRIGGDQQASYEIYDATYIKLLTPLRQTLSKTGQLQFSKGESGNGTTAIATTLGFGICSQLCQDYWQGYIGVLQSAVAGDLSDWDDYIGGEFASCNVQFVDPSVQEITSGEEWAVIDQGITYPVKVENGVLNIYIPPTDAQLAHRLVTAINELLEAIATHNDTEQTQYTLKQVPSQPYWRANDPVVLLAGEAAKASVRHGRDGRLRSDGLLDCHFLSATLDLQTLPSETINILQTEIEKLKPQGEEESIGFHNWTQQPWHPFLIEWAVQVFPCRPNPEQDYDPQLILDNYSLEPNAIDLVLIPGKESNFVANSNTYQGLSILTPSAGIQLQQRVTTYLNEQLLPYYYQENPGEVPTENYLSENFQKVVDWYNTQIGELSELEKAKDPIFVTLWAYQTMQNLDCQAQAIGGFNDTLLLYQPTLQLEIDDPLNSEDEFQLFHEQVRWTLGNSLQYKILLDGDIFNPIRSGAMSITTLWLIDTFGQKKEIIDSDMDIDTQVVTTTQMTPPNQTYQVLLPPRLAQPARLNFHWLAADTFNEEQTATTPPITPVCGWVVANKFDSNLLIHDDRGQALGLIDRAGRWRNAPDRNISCNEQNYPLLDNFHLQKMVHYLLDRGVDFQQDFISTIDNALETIDPENFAEHPSLALLVARPIALVRASFNLEVKGFPASDPSVSVIELQTIEDSEDNVLSTIPATHGFDSVKFSIRLGDYQQLNDGLVGYWKETPLGEDNYEYEGNIFYAPQSNLVDDNLIQTGKEGIVHFEQTLDAPPQFVTMLIDPRGCVHATPGILPNEELRLAPENYNEALQAIEVNFLSVPVLSNQGEISLPLPAIPDYVWSWVSLSNDTWSETTTIQPVNLKATFSAPQKLYEGWLQLTPAEDSNSNE